MCFRDSFWKTLKKWHAQALKKGSKFHFVFNGRMTFQVKIGTTEQNASGNVICFANETFSPSRKNNAQARNNPLKLSCFAVSTNKDGISSTFSEGFEVTDPETGQTVFSTDFTKLKFPKRTSSLNVTELNTHRVSCILARDLLLWLPPGIHVLKTRKELMSALAIFLSGDEQNQFWLEIRK